MLSLNIIMKYLIGFILLVGSSNIGFSQIRDTKSIMSPTDSKPLVIIDEVVLPKLVKSKIDSTKLVDPMTEIDTNEIESIDILKNESAVAMYGEAGKNGVVIVTTKAYVQKSKKK